MAQKRSDLWLSMKFEEKNVITIIYTTLWLAVALASLLTFFTEKVERVGRVVFNFIVFGLIFMRMISVLLSTIPHL